MAEDFRNLFGDTSGEQDINMGLGLLHMGASMFDPRVRTTSDAIGAGLGGGLGFVSNLQGQQHQQQKLDMRRRFMEEQMRSMEARRNRPYAFQPGSQIWQSGEQIGSVPHRPSSRMVKTMGPGGQPVYTPAPQAVGKPAYVRPRQPSVFSQKVQALVQSGVPPEIAQGIAAGRYALDRDFITGATQIIDKATGQRVYANPRVGGGEGAPGMGPQPESKSKIKIDGKTYTVIGQNPDGTVTVRGANGKEFKARRKEQ